MCPHMQSPPDDLSWSSASVEHVRGPPPRKKMRKGTKSCLQCRRRKIRCTFEPGNNTVACKECSARGMTCTDQEHGDAFSAMVASDQADNLRERVIYLEGLVEKALHQRREGPQSASPTPATETHSAETSKIQRDIPAASPQEISLPLPDGLQQDTPALSLFDNAVITRRGQLPQLSRNRYDKYKAVAKVLAALLPGPPELDIILEFSTRCWTSWHHFYPQMLDGTSDSFKDVFSQSLRSDSPAHVAKVMMCIAICIDQSSDHLDFSRAGLASSGRELAEQYMTKVDQLITCDDEIAGTVDGVECMILQSKYYLNVGRPRRAWLVQNRAISFAELLGFHRVALMKPKQSDPQLQRQLCSWIHLFLGDRYLAMTLGMPLRIHSRFCDPCIPELGDMSYMTESQRILLRTSSLMAKVVDRNQDPSVDLSTTFRLDGEMEELAGSVSAEWWGKLDSQASTQEERFDRLLCQFSYHLTRRLIHLPLMLRSSVDKRYHYSYTSALDSSRDVIRCYEALRAIDLGVPFTCKMIDFEAFCAAVLILLNLYGYSREVQTNGDQDQSDSALVDTTIEILGKASKETGGIVAVQSLKALEMMAEFRHGCRRETCGGHDSVKIVIPFFGTITLAAGKNFQIPEKGTFARPSAKQQRQTSNSNPATTTKANLGLPTPPSASGSTPYFSPPPSLHAEPSSSASSGLGSVLPTPFSGNDLPYAKQSSVPGHAPQQQHHHHHQQHQPQQLATNPTTDFFTEYPLISFDSYTPVPPTMGFDQLWGNVGGYTSGVMDGEAGSGNASSQLSSTINICEGTPMGVGMGTGTGVDPAGGSGNGIGSGFPTWISSGLDLDSSWNWIGLDAVPAPEAEFATATANMSAKRYDDNTTQRT